MGTFFQNKKISNKYVSARGEQWAELSCCKLAHTKYKGERADDNDYFRFRYIAVTRHFWRCYQRDLTPASAHCAKRQKKRAACWRLSCQCVCLLNSTSPNNLLFFLAAHPSKDLLCLFSLYFVVYVVVVVWLLLPIFVGWVNIIVFIMFCIVFVIMSCELSHS